ncbi:immunoglobulins domain-containing protein [Trichomonas vaginalis G3]|uniref:immunoglobulins domain-containing protein n=1 Tax=Trichomonas vaginalis (strain ATCC PRA-98 / G3) TaxID=412133 RepID=UPI0021E60FA2|nr:immunoglobulins domain-containing protein [Trichomonas vaginalis G3]KAI5534567.1 immunoglobulins domain-containing protein [Trichomonas vaginalis G3]
MASVYDQDSGDKPLTAKVSSTMQKLQHKKLQTAKILRHSNSKVPKDTAAGEYEVKVTATDGKKIGTKKFTITIKE